MAQQKLHLDDGTKEKLRYLAGYHEGNLSKAAAVAIETSYNIKQAQAEIKAEVVSIEDHPDFQRLLRYQSITTRG